MNNKDRDMIYGSTNIKQYYVEIIEKQFTLKQKFIFFIGRFFSVIEIILREFFIIGLYVTGFVLWLYITYLLIM